MGLRFIPTHAGWAGGPTVPVAWMRERLTRDAEGRNLLRSKLGLEPEPLPGFLRRVFGPKPQPDPPGVMPPELMARVLLANPDVKAEVKAELEAHQVTRPAWWKRPFV